MKALPSMPAMHTFATKEPPVAQLTVRKLDDGLVRALKIRAAAAGRSTEAEVRAILVEVLAPRTGPRDFVQHLLAIPVEPSDDDPFPRIGGSARAVDL